MKKLVSKCCGAEMTIGGEGKMPGSKHFYICLKCDKSCDIITIEHKKRGER